MTTRDRRGIVVLAAVALLTQWSAAAQAQVLGTFNFQLQPYCNVITMTITQEGATYRLAGFDNACNATQRFPMSGTITANQDGTLAFGFVVTRTSGIDVHTSFTFTPAPPYSGPWSDSAGNSGTFVFNGAATGLPARPGPTSSVPANSITTVNIVDGAIDAVDVNSAQVQLRVNGSCAVGQAVRAINANGTVVCGAIGAPTTLTDDNLLSVNLAASSCTDIAALNFGTVPAGTLTCDAVFHGVLNHTFSITDPSRVEVDFAQVASACAGNFQAGVFEIPAQLASFNGHDVAVPVKRSLAVSAGPLVSYLNVKMRNATTGTALGFGVSCTFTPQ